MATVRYTTVNGEVIAEKRAGVRRFYVPDAVGATVALLDSSQVQSDTFGFWPYGEEQARSGSTPTALRFGGGLGYYSDPSSVIYLAEGHLRADRGRLLTPNAMPSDQRTYAFAANRPSAFVPPRSRRAKPRPVGACKCDDVIANARRQVGQECYQPAQDPKSKWCSDVWWQAQKEAGCGFDAYCASRPKVGWPCHKRCAPEMIHNRIQCICARLKQLGKWEQPCKKPQPGDLVTWEIGGSTPCGFHSGVITKVNPDGSLAEACYCSSADGSKVVCAPPKPEYRVKACAHVCR